MQTFSIPANDDAIRAVRLLTAGIADAAIEGQTRFEIAQADREMPAESRRSDFAELFAGDEDARDVVPADIAAGADAETPAQLWTLSSHAASCSVASTMTVASFSCTYTERLAAFWRVKRW